MTEGRIKWYDEKKGYGFIQVENDEDLFFHRSGVADYGWFGLRKFDRVSFEVVITARGKQAVKVKPM